MSIPSVSVTMNLTGQEGSAIKVARKLKINPYGAASPTGSLLTPAPPAGQIQPR